MTLISNTLPLILLGDPDPESARKLTNLLESWHYSVEVVETGSEALARLEDDFPPAFALLDDNLPGLSGIEVVQEWHRKPCKNSVWTMVLSDTATPGQVSRAESAGVNDYLIKPILDIDLQVRLKTAERVQTLHSELHHSIEAMRFRSSHDNLTGLWNRESMLGILSQETDRVQRMKTPLCIMLLDLDDFSRVNNEYGFEGGDQILLQLALRFRRYLRSYDMIGRYGEDEFLIALPGCSDEHSSVIANRLRLCIFHRPFDVGIDSVKLAASFGIVPSKGRSPLVVMREAEYALKQAKLAGGDCVIRFGETPPILAPDSSEPAVKPLELPADSSKESSRAV